MRRRPHDQQLPAHLPAPPPGGRAAAAKPPNVSTQGGLIEPFLASGGASYFNSFASGDDVRNAGIQLVTSVYVPPGKVGFIKQIRIAPFMPPVFAQPWWTSGATSGAASWPEFNSSGYDGAPTRPAGQNGVWTTPLGWQSYAHWDTDQFDPPYPPAVIPVWQWSLRFLQGGTDQLRQQSTNLNPTPPEVNADGFIEDDGGQLYLVEGLAVPSSVYAGILPGTAPGAAWQAQPVQVLQGDPLDTHVMIPENTSACLFAQWQQAPIRPAARDGAGRIVYAPFEEYPLLPSFGSLHGYMQQSSATALANAMQGWGG